MSPENTCPRCGATLSAEELRSGDCESCLLELALESEGDAPSGDITPSGPDTRGNLGSGDKVGSFTLVRVLGEGGMGVVHLAEQAEPIRRTVALKIIKRGMDTEQVVARFEAERHALARMDHPSIATVFEAGETPDGRPFFAMEYIEGEPITRYCDARKLDMRERLALFVKVCEGIQHAHQKGVIHRDIKPSNVLVTTGGGEPLPKIIDFGVAKAIEQRLTERTLFTELGVLIGTPEYMSPEQAELSPFDPDTRTDVYSLGVLLYELLTGVLPFDSTELRAAGFDEIRRRIREERPSRPSTRIGELAPPARGDTASLSRRLAGDLDVITMKALEKEPVRRYNSPAELGADIERHLRHEPVLARPASAAYLLGKLISRHKFPAAFAAVLLAMLVGFAVWMNVLYRDARANLARALDAEAESAQVSDFMLDVFKVADPGEARGKSVTAAELLHTAAEKIDTGLADRPKVQARLMDAMGQVYMGLGLYDEAGQLLESSLATRRVLFDGTGPEVAAGLVGIGNVYVHRGEYEQSEEALAEAISILETAGPDHADMGAALHTLGAVHWRRGEYAKSEELWKRALTIREKAFGSESVEVAESLEYLGNAYLAMDRFDEAETVLLHAEALTERLLGSDHVELVATLQALAEVYRLQARNDEAEPVYLRALAINETVLGPEHPNLGYACNNLGLFYKRLGRFDEAEPLYLRALEIREASLPADHQLIAWTLDNLGMLYFDQNKFDEAEPRFLRARDIAGRAVGVEHPDYAIVLSNLALLRREQGRFADAEALAFQALEIWESKLDPGHHLIGKGCFNVASLYARTAREEKALDWYRRSEEILEASLGAEHPRTVDAREARAALTEKLGREG